MAPLRGSDWLSANIQERKSRKAGARAANLTSP
jgi:hypothetical protein